MRARLARHPNVTAAVLFAVLSLLFVGQGLLPGRTLSESDSFWKSYPWVTVKPATLYRAANPGVDDAPAVLQPFTRFTKSSLPHIPLWNPHIMTGRPFLANAQSAVFSPFNIPSYVLPYFTSLGWIAALKLWTAAFGMFLLARALAMRFAGATVAGLVYGFNLWIVAWLPYPHASVWALIPWLMLATEHMIRRPDVRGAAPLALLVGAQFLCGHPESSFHALLATSVYFVIRMIALRPDWRRPVAWFAGAMFIGLALAALVVLPFADLLLRSADIHQRANSARNVAANPRFIVPAFFPDWYGRPTQYALNVFELGRAWYGGALALILGAVALVIRPSLGRLLIAALGAACMMVVVGWGPVFDVVTHLPIFNGGHNARLAVLALFCLALLAGFGIDDVVARRGSVTRRRLAVGAAALVFAVPIVYALTSGLTAWAQAGHGLAVAWGFVTYQVAWAGKPYVVRDSAVWIWLVFAGLGLTLVAVALLARRRIAWSVLVVLAALIVYGDLARAGMGFNPAIPTSIETQPVTPAIDLLRTAGTARFVSVGDPIARGAVPQDALPMNYGLYESRGYDLPIERRFDHLWRTVLSPEYPSQSGPYLSAIPLSVPKMSPDRLHMLSVMGTRYIDELPREPPLLAPGMRLVRPGPDLAVYRNLRAQPRAAVVSAQTVAPDGDAALADVRAPSFRIDSTAVTEKPIAGLARAPRGAVRAPGGRARITRYGNDSLTVDASARAPGMLVLSDAWDPGWKATVDGHSADVHRVDYVFRGVQIPAGRHTVRFTYEPLTWRIGWVISLIALVGLGVACGVSWVRARSRRARNSITEEGGSATADGAPAIEG